jgi:tetratricopeptide (TPR) repeat protein
LHRYQEAIKYYDKAPELDPKYANAWNNKGSALYNLKRYDAYDKALEIGPNFDLAQINKRVAFNKLKKKRVGSENTK